MKKTITVLLAMAFLGAGLVLPEVRAYSPHYLPGGKNYLCVDNFQYASGVLSTIAPFLVKPYTDYALTIPRYYSENAEGSNVRIQFWDDDEEMEFLDYDASLDFSSVFGVYYFYVTFKTPAGINYLSLSFEDGREPLSLADVADMMLEEGTSSTAASGIEAYVPGTITDVNGPYFAGNPIVISNVDDPVTTAEIAGAITAHDDVEGDVTDSIEIITDGYSGNGGTLGNYAILFEASDSLGNTTEFSVTVKVVDVTDPMITGPGSISVPHPQVKTVAELKSLLSASDNYDSAASLEIQLVSDGYTANSAVIGEYDVVFAVADSSGNEFSYTLTVCVVDTALPVFSGISEVTVGYDRTLSVEGVRSSLSALDGYDGDLTASILLESDGYTTHAHEVGEYILVFSVTDAHGNTQQKSVIVQVVDQIGPIVYFDASTIRIYDSAVLALTDFTTLLIRAGELDGETAYAVDIRFDSYTANATTPGTYHLSLNFTDPEGKVLMKTFQILVKESGNGNPDLLPGVDKMSSWLDKNASWLVGTAFLTAIAASWLVVFFLKRKPI